MSESTPLLYSEILKRLPYGVRVILNGEKNPRYASELDITNNTQLLEGMKLYLRPLMDMKEEEKDDIKEILRSVNTSSNPKVHDLFEQITVTCFHIRRELDEIGNGSSPLDMVQYKTMGRIVDYLRSKQFELSDNEIPQEYVQWYSTNKDGLENTL